MVALVWLALRAEAWAAVAGAFLMGLLRDGVSAGPVGGWALVMILEALLIKALLAAVDTGRTWRGVSALTASAVLAGGIVLYPVLLYFYSGVSPVRVFHRHLDIYCIQGLTTALAGLPVFRLLDRAAAGGAE